MNNATAYINLLDSVSCLNIHNTYIYPDLYNGNGRRIMINMASQGIGNSTFNQYANFAIGAVLNTSGTVATNGTSLDINVGCAIVGTPNYTLITAMTIAGQSLGVAYVGIGTTSPAYTLDVNGTIRSTGQITAISFNAGSDYRIKKNIQSIESTKTIDLLHPVEYDLSGGKHDMGFLAHEVQELFPFLVEGQKDGENIQSLNYNGFIALLVKEVQDLKKENLELKEKNNSFESRLQAIEQILNK